jgi:hypothetical protein
MEFLIVCRAELDRMIEQSPAVPDDIINEFKREFPDSELSKPIKWNDMEKTLIHTPKEEKLGSVVGRAATVLKGNNRLLKEVATPQVKKELAEEIMRRQTTPPTPSLRETIRTDLDALKTSGIVSQFFNKSVKQFPAPRSERSPEPAVEDEHIYVDTIEDITNVDVVVSVEVPEASAPSDTCPESEDSRERASNV